MRLLKRCRAKKRAETNTRCRTSSFWAHVVNLKCVFFPSLLLMWKSSQKMKYVFKMPPVGHFIVLNSRSLVCSLAWSVAVAKSNLFFFLFYSKTKLSKQWQWILKKKQHRQWTTETKAYQHDLIYAQSSWFACCPDEIKKIMVCFWHIKPSNIHANFIFFSLKFVF